MPNRDMLVNFVPGEECRIAILENGRLEEFYQERVSAESHVGNIYKGRVSNVEPSIQAAFIDFGLERNGFLHISDLHPMYFPGDYKEETETVGQKTPRRDRPPIQKCLHRGQDILVQVLKEGIGTKGPTLTSYLSIPGRYLVMMPHMEKLGVSRKVEDDDARREMRQVLAELKPPEGFGFIIRTAGMGRPKTDLKRDLAYLVRLWKVMDQRMKSSRNVGELYTESDLVIRTIRDVFSNDITRLIVDNPDAARRAHDFLSIASPRSASKVLMYNDPIPLFHRFDVERQIENINARIVPLPSGGSLVIDSTEALVAIDVNSGKNRDNRDAEMTAYKTNLEATDEICRQLRLRDLGGVVVNDLIDMRSPKHRRDIEQRFRNNLKNDRARTRIQAISQFGILEMTRQRMRPSLAKSTYSTCTTCQGAGMVKSPETVVLEVMRRLTLAMQRQEVMRIELTVSPDVAFQLLNRKRIQLVEMEKYSGKPVMVRVHSGHPPDLIELQCFDSRGGATPSIPPGPWSEPVIQPFEPLDVSEQVDEELEEEETPEAPDREYATDQDDLVEANEQNTPANDIQSTTSGELESKLINPPVDKKTSATITPHVPATQVHSDAFSAANEVQKSGESATKSSGAPAVDQPAVAERNGRRRRRRRGRGGRGEQDQARAGTPSITSHASSTAATRSSAVNQQPAKETQYSVESNQTPPSPSIQAQIPSTVPALEPVDDDMDQDQDNIGNRIEDEDSQASGPSSQSAAASVTLPQGQGSSSSRRRRRRRGRGRGQGGGQATQVQSQQSSGGQTVHSGQASTAHQNQPPGNQPPRNQPSRPQIHPKPPAKPMPPQSNRHQPPFRNNRPQRQGGQHHPQQPRGPMPTSNQSSNQSSQQHSVSNTQTQPSRGYRNINQINPASTTPKPRSEPT